MIVKQNPGSSEYYVDDKATKLNATLSGSDNFKEAIAVTGGKVVLQSMGFDIGRYAGELRYPKVEDSASCKLSDYSKSP